MASLPSELERVIDDAFDDRAAWTTTSVVAVVTAILEALDRGELRVAERDGAGGWRTNAWVKRAILMFFASRGLTTHEVGPFEWRDKIPLKRGLDAVGVRLVPPGAIRYGAFVGRGAVVMPGYVNVGARVGERSMVDTWATVGSCAQIGDDVHLSGGVGIGGVLEPPQASPVIVEDGAFIGSRAVIVEGVRVGAEAVIGANVVLTASTPIIDVRGAEAVEHRGVVPPRAVVIPGAREKRFPAGTFHVPCALIIGERTASTDRKVSLESALRDHAVAV